MKRLASILVPLVALVAGLLIPAPAPAAGPAAVPWPTAPCASGAMTTQSLPERLVWIEGWVEPCAGTAAPAGALYAIVYFGPQFGQAKRGLTYPHPTARASFEGQLYGTKLAPPTAACLAFSPTGPLSCVSIDIGDDPDRLVVTPIPTDHPRVTVPVLDDIKPETLGWPYCGNCL